MNVARGACQSACDVSGWFMPVNDKIAKGSGRAALFLRTASALHGRGGIDVALSSTSHAAVAQRFLFRAIVNVFRRCISKLVTGEMSMRLMATIDDRNVGLNVPR